MRLVPAILRCTRCPRDPRSTSAAGPAPGLARGISAGLCGGGRGDHRPRPRRPHRLRRGLPAGRRGDVEDHWYSHGQPAARSRPHLDPRAHGRSPRRRTAVHGDRRRSRRAAGRPRPGRAQRRLRLVDDRAGVRTGAAHASRAPAAVHHRPLQAALAPAAQPQAGVTRRALRRRPAAGAPRARRRTRAGRGVPAEPASGRPARGAAAAAGLPAAVGAGRRAARAEATAPGAAVVRAASRSYALQLAPLAAAAPVSVPEPGPVRAGRPARAGHAGRHLGRHLDGPRAAGGPGHRGGAAHLLARLASHEPAGHQRSRAR